MIDGYTSPPPSSPGPTSDAEKNKAFAILAYFVFFLPLIAARDSTFAMFHANQGLNLLLLFVVVNVLGTFIPIIGWFIIYPVGYIFAVVLLILGIANAARGATKPLPLIGKFNLLRV